MGERDDKGKNLLNLLEYREANQIFFWLKQTSSCSRKDTLFLFLHFIERSMIATTFWISFVVISSLLAFQEIFF